MLTGVEQEDGQTEIDSVRWQNVREDALGIHFDQRVILAWREEDEEHHGGPENQRNEAGQTTDMQCSEGAQSESARVGWVTIRLSVDASHRIATSFQALHDVNDLIPSIRVKGACTDRATDGEERSDQERSVS